MICDDQKIESLPKFCNRKTEVVNFRQALNLYVQISRQLIVILYACLLNVFPVSFLGDLLERFALGFGCPDDSDDHGDEQ